MCVTGGLEEPLLEVTVQFLFTFPAFMKINLQIKQFDEYID